MSRILTPKYRYATINEIDKQVIWYCPEHKEYFSNNCSECMLIANDPDTIAKTAKIVREETLKEVGKALTKIYTEAGMSRDLIDAIAKLSQGVMPE